MPVFQGLYEAGKGNTDPAFTVALLILLIISIIGLGVIIVTSIQYSDTYERISSRFQRNKYLDKEIVRIYNDNNGTKMIKLCGYGYCCDGSDNEITPYRLIEYAWFELPLEKVLNTGFEEVALEWSCEYKQYTTEASIEDFVKFYKTYDSGKPPKKLLLSDLDINTRNGYYFVICDK